MGRERGGGGVGGISADLVFSESELMAMIHGEGRTASEFTMRRRWCWAEMGTCPALPLPPPIVQCRGQG